MAARSYRDDHHLHRLGQRSRIRIPYGCFRGCSSWDWFCSGAEPAWFLAPEGFSQLLARVASSRSSSRSLQASASNTSLPSIVEALPGGKINLGYAYQVLQLVVEEIGQSSRPTDAAGNASGFWDLATPQRGLLVGPLNFMGRKRAATSTALGSGRRVLDNSCRQTIFHLRIRWTHQSRIGPPIPTPYARRHLCRLLL